MKRIISFAVVLLMLSPFCANALTVKEFVEAYNAQIGEGMTVSTLWNQPDPDNHVWFLMSLYEGTFVAIMYTPNGADQPEDCQVEAVFVRHKPRCSMAEFQAAAQTALAVIYPSISAEIRNAAICQCMANSIFVFGEAPKNPMPYNTAEFGQMVYQETLEYDTFMFNAPD